MNAITLPKDLRAWAEAEVAAGRAASVEALTIAALEDLRETREAFLKSLDEASESARRGEGIPMAEAFEEVDALLDTLEQFRRDQAKKRRNVA